MTDNETDTDFQDRLAQQVEAMIAKDKTDPRQQMYMQNATTGRLIKSAAMYHRAVENKQGITEITYNRALELLKEEKAARHRALNVRKKRRSVKQARKVNRG